MKFMNKIIMSLAVFALCFNLANATNFTPSVKVDVGVAKKFNLTLKNVTAETTVKIIDEEGFILIEEKVAAATANFAKIFNMESLKNGRYQLNIESEMKETIQPIIVTSKGLVVDENKREEYFPAIIELGKKNFNLSLLNPTKSTVIVSILDQYGDIIYQDEMRKEMLIEKSYKLDKLPSGYYTVLVNTGNDSYTEDLVLK